MEINYIRIKEKPVDIMANNVFKDDYVKLMKRIMGGELWKLVKNERDNVKDNGVLNGFMYCDLA